MEARVSAAPPEWRDGVRQACNWLLDHQQAEGLWAGRLETNSCMEAEWILARHVVGLGADAKYDRVVRAILREQRPDGSWAVYHGAPQGDVNATVECYAALRAAGQPVNDPALVLARAWIFEHDALRRVRVFTRYWLALIGEWPWTETPDLPPEIIFQPRWMPFNIYRFASWARATILPLAVLSCRRFVRPLRPECRLGELFPAGRDTFDYKLPSRRGFWAVLFRAVDGLLRRYTTLGNHFGIAPGRETAIKLCLEWIVRHQEADGAWSGIQPPWIYSLMALHCEGFAADHPVVAAGWEAFNKHWRIDEDDATYLQASESPVWDTLLSSLCLLEAGYSPEESPELSKAVDWILERQSTSSGDWNLAVNAVTGGWAFERHNRFYPDVDDTSVALIFLAKLKRTSGYRRADVESAVARAVQWTLAMQSSNGGWGAFDKDNKSRLIAAIPFCDFGETMDPPSVDVTAHVVEAFGELGFDAGHPAIRKALHYIRTEQEADGSWFGRWGVNHIYGTWSVLVAMGAIGENMHRDEFRRAADWLVDHQNADGGWGESCRSYMEEDWRGRGDSTASQTGWALMGLLAMRQDRYADAIQRGVAYLIDRQAGGTWHESEYTGTGFPGYGVGERVSLKRPGQTLDQGGELSRGFMLNYHMYRHYFPTMAVNRVVRQFAAGTVFDRTMSPETTSEPDAVLDTVPLFSDAVQRRLGA